MASRVSPNLARRLRRVRLFLCDVDGVLTDGSVYMGHGMELKRFHIPDGLGLRLLQREGIRVGWVSNRASAATVQRAEDLKVDFLVQLQGGKVGAVEDILGKSGYAWDEVGYMGDDVVDLPVLRRAGLAVVPANGIREAKRVAHYTTRAEGGRGAVREVVDMVLRAQGRWSALVDHYMSLV